MLPEPFFGAFGNPLLQQVIDLPHGKIDILLHVFGFRHVNGGKEMLHEMYPIRPVFAPSYHRRNDRNVKTPRQLDRG